jgi:hypothetical protein
MNIVKVKMEADRERERVRKDSIRVEVKRKHLGESERRFISEGERKSILLEGTQAMSARPSDKDRMRVNMLRWWMVKAARTSETSVDNYFTRQYIPEDNSEQHTRRHENLKSHTVYNNNNNL